MSDQSLDRIAAVIVELAPELRSDLIRAIDAHAGRWFHTGQHRPIPVWAKRRIARLEAFADALAKIPAHNSVERKP